MRNCLIRKPVICLWLAFLGGCSTPAWHLMPRQRPSPQAVDPPAWRSFVTFGDPDQAGFVLRDIGPGDGQAWTFAHPELRFWVRPRPGLRFSLVIRLVQRTLRDTGPVTITIKVNGHPLGSIHADHDGEYHFDQPVPADWIQIGEPVNVSMEANHLWVDPAGPPDGVRLGFLIVEAGFR